MDKNKSSVHDLIVTYGVAVVSLISALTLGAYTIAGAIAMFADTSASMPSIFGLLGGGGTTSLVVTGAIATVLAIVAHLSMSKIASSSAAGELVSSDNYTLINKRAKAFCLIMAGVAVVSAVAVLLAAVLSISDYTPWKSYLLGEVLPLLFTACGLIVASVLIGKFVRAEVKPNILAVVALAVAIAGIVLACVAVLVKSHTSTKSVDNASQNLYRRLLDY